VLNSFRYRFENESNRNNGKSKIEAYFWSHQTLAGRRGGARGLTGQVNRSFISRSFEYALKQMKSLQIGQ
jgi:hypothetical protein